MSATHPIGYRSIEKLSTVLRSRTLMGHGKGGEVWICVTCFEGVLDDKLYRSLLGDKTPPPSLHQLIQWLNFIVPETRSLPGFPGLITLTSPQRHTVQLWVAVHRWIVYLCENPTVKKLLNGGVYVGKAFPSDLFPALNGSEALYLNVETRDFKGYTPNNKIAELKWDQVLCTTLSNSLAMSDQLVEFLVEEPVDVSYQESEGLQRSFDGEDSLQSGSGDDEEDDLDDKEGDIDDENDDTDDEEDNNSENEEEDAEEDGETVGAILDAGVKDRGTGSLIVNDPSAKPLSVAETTYTSPSTPPAAASEPAAHGRKRDHEGHSLLEPTAANSPQVDHDTDSEGEERRSKRAKLAWKGYIGSPHCS